MLNYTHKRGIVFMFLCPYCDKSYDKMVSLSLHSNHTHKKSTKQLYVDMNLNGIEPTCKCGCGKPVKFLDSGRGFRDFKQGHSIRVMDNPCTTRTKETWEQISKTRKEKFANGETVPWCKGLTKEIDYRLHAYGEKGSNTIKSNANEIKQRSKRMKENRINGTVPTLCREQHSQWNGGISPLNQYCHANRKLYSNWKYPILLAAKFQCNNCNKTSLEATLHVHHNKETFSSILRHFAKLHKWEEALCTSLPEDNTSQFIKEAISNDIADYHVKNNVSGIVLCEECHKKEHAKLNF